MTHRSRIESWLMCLAVIAMLGPTAVAQEGRPKPEDPPAAEPPVVEEVVVEEVVVETAPGETAPGETAPGETAPGEAAPGEAAPGEAAPETVEETVETEDDSSILWTTDGIRADRRAVRDEPVILAFKDVKLDELIEFIAVETGKIVMPIGLSGRGATSQTTYNIVADQSMPRTAALDFIFTYLRMNDIGIIERPDVIFVGKLEDMLTELSEIEVVSASTSIADRTDRGTLVFKIFQVHRNSASNIRNDLQDLFPENYAKIKENDLANQIMMIGDVGLAQQLEIIIGDLDQNWILPDVATFRLKYADASEISDNIADLFEQSGTTTRRTSGTTQQRRSGSSGANNRNTNSGSASASQGRTEAELRWTVNVQQNSVTVSGEAETVEEIRLLIETQWDRPRPEGTSRLFILKYTDPIKVKDLLLSVIGGGSSSSGSSGQRRGGNTQRADASESIAGVYQFEAFPDRNALLVLAKTEESFDFIESVINEIDQPSEAGLPEIISLRYADAVELAEEINVLLGRAGGQAQLPRPESGLTAEGFSAGSSDSGLGLSGPSSSQTSQVINFPWSGGNQATDQSPESSLIGKVRVVPIIRQNALAILAPESYKEQMRKLIEAFDRPRRQVLLSATVVEVDLGDALNLGILFGTQGSLTGIATGPQLTTGATFGGGGGTADPLSFLFNNLLSSTATSGLVTVGPFDLELIIQAMNVITNTRIIQEPRVFTADNEEAVFFSGKEFPIATGTSTSDVGGGTTTTIDYKNVGVFLNVRPRITEEGAVDLAVSLELSDNIDRVSVGNTFSEVFSRKQVTSHVIVLDGQTLVIGGLLKESEQITRHRIPLLADIPIIGPLFEYNDEKLDRSELIAFITPTVVHRPLDNFDNFNLQDLARLESVARPLADQINDTQKMIDLNVYERVRRKPRGPRTEILPDRDPAQSEIDAFTPLLIEHDPNDPTEPVKKP